MGNNIFIVIVKQLVDDESRRGRDDNVFLVMSVMFFIIGIFVIIDSIKKLKEIRALSEEWIVLKAEIITPKETNNILNRNNKISVYCKYLIDDIWYEEKSSNYIINLENFNIGKTINIWVNPMNVNEFFVDVEKIVKDRKNGVGFGITFTAIATLFIVFSIFVSSSNSNSNSANLSQQNSMPILIVLFLGLILFGLIYFLIYRYKRVTKNLNWIQFKGEITDVYRNKFYNKEYKCYEYYSICKYTINDKVYTGRSLDFHRDKNFLRIGSIIDIWVNPEELHDYKISIKSNKDNFIKDNLAIIFMIIMTGYILLSLMQSLF